ncbi:Spo0E family sporulation regulatory protein-aspartic acid phosphatase [Phosphitispora sp. TUW77]|uniref:Spo0E family sporulation regulatory protein-aspartic acid phosphatase n=1 Tax=Phosphitispora sp. TUW77 TaxID=3152361 RepID=UPI003AB4C544
MWTNRREFRKMIREKQREMYRLVNEKGMQDPDVYNKSCELDCLIVEYMKRYNSYISLSMFNNYY